MTVHRRSYPTRFGPYVLLEPLATGGMGHVALAMFRESGSQRVCVVKRLLPHLLKKEGYVRRFEDEANLARRLKHDCIVQTLATGQVDGEPFIAQAFIDGRDVSEIASRMATREAGIPLLLAVHLVREVCRGLVYAHDFEDLNLVHRDISPQNLRVAFAGGVKIMDFGLAFSKDKKSLTAPGALLGRAAYMPPEQLAGEPTDRRADLYSLGVVLWELLTGQLFGTTLQDGKPTYAPDPRAALARAFNPRPLPPSTFDVTISPELDAVVLRAVNPAKTQRYQNATEMRAALADFLPADFDGERLLGAFLRDLCPPGHEQAHRDELVAAASIEFASEEEPPPVNPTPPAAANDVHQVAGASSVQTVPVRLGRSHRAAAAGGAVALCLLGIGAWMKLTPSSKPVVDVEPVLTRPRSSQASIDAALALAEVPPTPSATAEPSKARPPSRRDVAAAPVKPSPVRPSAEPAAGLLASAQNAFLNGDLSTALRDGEAAFRAGAGAEALAIVGDVHFSQRRFAEAEAAYAHAARLAPTNKKVADRLKAARDMVSLP